MVTSFVTGFIQKFEQLQSGLHQMLVIFCKKLDQIV